MKPNRDRKEAVSMRILLGRTPFTGRRHYPFQTHVDGHGAIHFVIVRDRSPQCTQPGALRTAHCNRLRPSGVRKRVDGFIALGERILERRYDVGLGGLGRCIACLRRSIESRAGAKIRIGDMSQQLAERPHFGSGLERIVGLRYFVGRFQNVVLDIGVGTLDLGAQRVLSLRKRAASSDGGAEHHYGIAIHEQSPCFIV